MAASLLNFPGLSKRSQAFVDGVRDVAASLGVEPNWLLAVMQAESGINPAALNDASGATGLIQFMPATAKLLKTTASKLRKMADSKQLEYVKSFYAPWAHKLTSAGDLYLATFWPAAVATPDSYAIAVDGDPVYRANKGLDVNNDGTLTAGDVRAFINRVLERYANTAFVEPKYAIPPKSSKGVVIVAVVAIAAGIFGASRLLRGHL
ncbi:MAG: hypothetical protein A2V70_01255 [Planctomycetes bacterium RBG_13_63_9]|nr:MAG: hypothetical protein A2V70_01255 [Planctomycetes bacterium RBG_13_63_9]